MRKEYKSPEMELVEMNNNDIIKPLVVMISLQQVVLIIII